MQFDNIDDIITDLRSKWGSTGKGVDQPEGYQEQPDRSQLFPSRKGVGMTSLQPKATRTEEGVSIFRPADYSVDPNAIYDRLRDGSYVAKFENYLGETGNEDRLAREQSTGEKWWNGIQKFVGKTGNYAFDSVVGTAYGIFNGIAEGDFRGVWDNDLSNWMDDLNKKMDYDLPNYYTDEEKSMGFLESMTTANFCDRDWETIG